MGRVYKYRIHPAVGVARLGNSDEKFDGPEVPQEDFPGDGAPNQFYRDAAGKIRRQAAVFRIYEFVYPNALIAGAIAGKPSRVREITMNDAHIEWSVTLANRKSLDKDGNKSPIIPPEIKLNVVNQPRATIQGNFDNKIGGAVPVLLGEAETDSAGRLRVLAGKGVSDSPGIAKPVPPGHDLGDYRVNNGWYDDIADGPVKATVDFTGFPNPPAGVIGTQSADSAWLVTAAPDYAHAVEHIVSLYDIAYTIAFWHFKLPRSSKPSFTRDIYPILHKAMMAHWTSNLLQSVYGSANAIIARHHFEAASFDSQTDPNFRSYGASRFNLLKSGVTTPGSPERAARNVVFAKLRNPIGGGAGDMPRLLLDVPPAGTGPVKDLALTQFHYKLLMRWAEGDFDADWVGAPVVTPFSALPPEKQPEALDQAHMRSMVGGAFFPGIEVGKIVRKHSTWSAPFRIDASLDPGTLTETLAMPWQADFFACEAQDDSAGVLNEWWPSHRPISVLPGTATDYSGFKGWVSFSTMIEMVTRWNELGFLRKKIVVPDNTFYVQREPDS